MAGVAKIHDSLGCVDTLADHVLPPGNVELRLNQSAVDTHPDRHRRLPGSYGPAHVYGALRGGDDVTEEEQSHAVACWQRLYGCRLARGREGRGGVYRCIQLVENPALARGGLLGPSDDIQEEYVGYPGGT